MVVIRGMFHSEAEQMWESKKARQVANRMCPLSFSNGLVCVGIYDR